MKNNSPRGELIILSFACVLYLVCLRAYFVGFFNDDAFYIIGARSLLQGSYVELNSPDLRALDNYPPGYPLLLALWSVFGGSTLSFQLLSVILTLASVRLLWKLFDDEKDAALPAAALFALGPMTASLSGVVLSEVLFMPLALLTVVLAKRLWPALTTKQAAALGALAGFAALARLSGVSLWAALWLCLAFERRFKRAAAAAAAGAAIFVPWLIRNALLTGRSETRISELLDWQAGPAGVLSTAFKSAGFYAHEAFARALFRFPQGETYAEAAAATAGVLLLGYGLKRWGLKGWRKLAPVFLACYAAVHLAWPYQSSRYLYPVLPFIAGFFLLGAAKAGGKRLAWGAAALGLILGAFPVSTIARASLRGGTPMSEPPAATYGWIRANTDASAVFASDLDGRLHLLTGRRSMRLPARTADFGAWLKSTPADFVLLFPNERVMRRARGAGGADPFSPAELAALLGDRKRFEPVFRSAEEGSIVYGVKR